jgi:hypothetical protein
MKTLIIRAFVVALTLTGAAATAHTSNVSAKKAVVVSGVPPTPLCPYGDPNGCGID